MTELNAVQIIRATRQTKHYLAISAAEIDFITTYPHLSDGEKLIWITFANKCAFDHHYSCILTQGQLAKLMGKQIGTITRAIANLKKLGFLKSESTSVGPLMYFLSLPQSGLESLLAAPARKMMTEPLSKNTYPPIENDRSPLSKNTYPPIENDRSPLAKTLDLLIYNNINNIKHNHDAHSEIFATPSLSPETDVQDADALICDFTKIIQEKYQHLTVFKRSQAALSHFTDVQKRAINERQLELAAIADGKKLQEAQAQAQRFNEQLAQAKPVTASPSSKLPNGKLVEIEFDNEHFVIEESVKDQILSQIPNLYQKNKILGEAGKKSLVNLLKEIFYFVVKAGSKTLDTCQLKRYYIARKLCLKGAWERPNGLVRQASINREQQWQQAKIAENKFAKDFTKEFMQNMA